MKAGKVTIRVSQSGWVIYFDNDVTNFQVFRSDEPERFVRFVAEKVAGIKIDQVVESRKAEIAEADRKMQAAQHHA